MSFLFSKYIKVHRHFVKIVDSFNLAHQENSIKYINKRCMSQNLNQYVLKKGKSFTFNDIVKTRQNEAKRSILVQVQSAQSYKELYSYCSTHGTIIQMLHYSAGVEPLHFIIVEFANESDVKNILNISGQIKDYQIVPVNSHFLWFKATTKNNPKLKQYKNAKLHIENGNFIIKDVDLIEQLKMADDPADQMIKLHNLTKLNDVGIRLRFLVARQIELALSGMFPNATALPFGSSVNGYGKMGCDLDLVLKLNDYQMNSDISRLMFQCKGITASERTISQRYMETLGDILQLFLPGCTQVRRILQARVPIIKYYHQFADVECDLSMSNLSGVHMSEFLYLMSSIDERVKPLVFTIRKWASSVGLTNTSPGRWISNFSLTLLVLAFLQKPPSSTPILPSFNNLVKQAGPDDVYITDEGINCTFLRNSDNLKFANNNNNDLNNLLKEFFEFYSQFDFSTKAVSLNDGSPITKPESSPMYIVNPLERALNVSKNVSIEELERFKMEIRNAAWLLESQENKTSIWGILLLFDNKKKNKSSLNVQTKHSKLLQVSKLFTDDSESYNENNISGSRKDDLLANNLQNRSKSRR